VIDEENIIVVGPWQNQGQGVPVNLPDESHHPLAPNAFKIKNPQVIVGS